MRNFIILGLMIFVCSCSKTDDIVDLCIFPPCDPPEEMNTENFCFAVPHHEDTLLCGSMIPIAGEKVVIFSDLFCHINPERSIVSGYDKFTGEKLWTWDDHKNFIFGLYKSGYHDGIFVFKNSQYTWGIDELSGKVLWAKNIEDGGGFGDPRMGFFGDRMFYGNYGPGLFPASGCLVRASIYSGEIEQTLFCKFGLNFGGFGPSFESYTLWENEKGEEIIFVSSRSKAIEGNYKERDDILAYNITMDSMWWEKWDVTLGTEGGSISKFTIYDDKLYYKSAFSIHCFNLFNGDKLWQTDIRSIDPIAGASFNPLLIINDQLFLLGKYIIVLDPQTGFLLYTTEDQYHCNFPKNAIEYENKIIYHNSGGLACFDPKYHKVIWSFGPPFDRKPGYSPYYDWGLELDRENKRIYASDSYFGVCLGNTRIE